MSKLSSGRTQREWRPLWRNDLWASSNYKSLPINYKGYYDIIWSLCRDEDYAGMLCFPTGVPMTLKEIISDMLPQPGDRIDRVKAGILELIRRGMLYLKDIKSKEVISAISPINEAWIGGDTSRILVLVVRKYAEKSAQGCLGVGIGLSGGCQEVGKTPPDNKGVQDEKGQKDPPPSYIRIKNEDIKKEESKTPQDPIWQMADDLAKQITPKFPDRKQEWIRGTFISIINKGHKAALIQSVISKHPELDDKGIRDLIGSGKAKTETCKRCKGQGEIYGGSNRGEIPCPECKAGGSSK